VGSGISAKDRLQTIKALIDESSSIKDFGMPGHVFPLFANALGVLGRQGHTEASVDLARLSGHYPAGAIGELVNADGTVKSFFQLEEFSLKHGIKMVSIEDLIKFREEKKEFSNELNEGKKEEINGLNGQEESIDEPEKEDELIKIESCAHLPTEFGEFKLYAFSFSPDNSVHLALVKGDVKGKEVLARVHSRCITGEVFHSLKCDCGAQLDTALKKISDAGTGIIVYLFQEGRGIGIIGKIRAYCLQEKGLDTVEANTALGYRPDLRNFLPAALILKKLGIEKIRLMTNNPDKIKQLEENGIKVTERIPIKFAPTVFSESYFEAKKEKLGHLL